VCSCRGYVLGRIKDMNAVQQRKPLTAAQIAKKKRRAEKRRLKLQSNPQPPPRQGRRPKRRSPKGGGDQVQPQIGETKKQFARDLRNNAATGGPLISVDLASQQRALVVTQPVNPQTVAGVCAAYVSYAFQSGYMAETVNSNNPYFALNYMLGILQSYMQGSANLGLSLPIWFLRLCQAVQPKDITMQQGTVKYAWALSPGIVAQTGLSVGPPSYDYIWGPWLPGDTAAGTDEFGVCMEPASYTPELGASAWSELTQFMAKGTKRGINEMVAAVTETPYLKDVSAFSVNFVNTGGGQNGVGGFGTTVSLEVPIRHPVLGSFYTPQYNQPAVENRYPVFDNAFSGDSFFLGGFLSAIGEVQDMGTKIAPRFHCVDFNEFLDVLGQWICQLITAYTQDPEFSLTQGVNSTPPVLTCPCSFQEVALLLRATMMEAFKDTQPAVQSLFPALPQSNTDVQFTPFLAASNSCAGITTSGMLLPEGLVENIRSLTMRRVKTKKFVCVLCSYFGIV